MINILGTPSSEMQINFGVLEIDAKNSATTINPLQALKSQNIQSKHLINCVTSFLTIFLLNRISKKHVLSFKHLRRCR